MRRAGPFEWSATLMACVLICGGLSPSRGFAANPTLEELVRLHERSLDGVKQISLDLHLTVKHFRNGTEAKPEYSTTWTWARADQKERVRFGDPLQQDSDGHQSARVLSDPP